MASRCFMSYSTANDDPSFGRDIVNFENFATRNPGPCSIALYISVSEVLPRGNHENKTLERLRKLVESSKVFHVQSIQYKSNIGRDFSSAKENLRRIVQVGSPSDYIFFSNRSAFGPLRDSWYEQFIAQFEKFSAIGLCGNTINRPCLNNPAHTHDLHVQTYAYLTTVKHFVDLACFMPGEKARTRQETIDQGELELSRHIFTEGLGLTSLAWPDHSFTRADDDVSPDLPCGNMTTQPEHRHIMDQLPFRHWHYGEKAKPRSLGRRLDLAIARTRTRFQKRRLDKATGPETGT